jgi:hypothetical protein
VGPQFVSSFLCYIKLFSLLHIDCIVLNWRRTADDKGERNWLWHTLGTSFLEGSEKTKTISLSLASLRREPNLKTFDNANHSTIASSECLLKDQLHLFTFLILLNYTIKSWHNILNKSTELNLMYPDLRQYYTYMYTRYLYVSPPSAATVSIVKGKAVPLTNLWSIRRMPSIT